MATNPNETLVRITHLVNLQKQGTFKGTPAMQALNDIEQMVGKLERMYIQHVAMAREEGIKMERARCRSIVNRFGLASPVDALMDLIDDNEVL